MRKVLEYQRNSPLSQYKPCHPAAQPASQLPVTWLHTALSLQCPEHWCLQSGPYHPIAHALKERTSLLYTDRVKDLLHAILWNQYEQIPWASWIGHQYLFQRILNQAVISVRPCKPHSLSIWKPSTPSLLITQRAIRTFITFYSKKKETRIL